MASRTPGPWKANENYGRHWISAGKGKKQIHIADVADIEIEVANGEVESDTATTKANADFIVRACNCFDELLMAAKAALVKFEYSPLDKVSVAGDMLRAAIAKAERQ